MGFYATVNLNMKVMKIGRNITINNPVPAAERMACQSEHYAFIIRLKIDLYGYFGKI